MSRCLILWLAIAFCMTAEAGFKIDRSRRAGLQTTSVEKAPHAPNGVCRLLLLTSDGDKVTYGRPDRTYEEVVFYYPESWTADLGEKKVLDMASGQGYFVQGLRARGGDAYGLDIFLTPAQSAKPYFLKADAASTRLESKQFDVIFMTWGMITYEVERSPTRAKRFLDEMLRLVKDDGAIRISPLGDAMVPHLKEILDLSRTDIELVRGKNWIAAQITKKQ